MAKTEGFLLLAMGLTIALGFSVNDTSTTQSAESNDTQLFNTTTRQGRKVQEIIELPLPSKKTKRQIIKIPSSVSRVKLLQPPLNLRHNRAPQQFSRYPPIYRSGGPWRATSKKSRTDYNAEIENSFLYDPQKVKRNPKTPFVKEVTPEEFYRDEEFDPEEGKHRSRRVRKPGSVQKVIKIKRKKPKKNVLSEYLASYEGDDGVNYEEGGGMDSSKIRHAGGEENQSFHGYESAGSSIRMEKVPPPTTLAQFNDENYVHGLNVKKLPTKGRQIQSLFAQQYTTHNPHVTTNFGLNEVVHPNGVLSQQGGKGSFVDASPFEFSQFEKYSQPISASSEQIVTALPVRTPGIEVIQPPQFRDVTVSHPLHSSSLISPAPRQREEISSQKATIKDILEQDCPSFDVKGYCDSPPRYPMQQIKNIVKKCAHFMEVMNTQPFEEPHETYGFARRSDNHVDNRSISVTLGLDSHSPPWSRSSNDDHTVCTSDLELTEPGYAKEAGSARWFVIVQHPDTTVQRIATDTCRNPGKSCVGLSVLKCTRIKNPHGKTTRCVQRHTYQRLISWDPESPEECPRMRVFRFPSACVCHLGAV